MPILESAATSIATKVLQQIAAAGVTVAQGKITDARHKAAFAKAVAKAFDAFDARYPDWSASLLDASFLENEAGPYLAQLLLPTGTIKPTELAELWADSIALRSPDQRRARVRELEAPIAGFIDALQAEIEKEPLFRTLMNERLLSDLNRDIKLLVTAASAGKATPGTRIDYLRWLCNRYSHIDPRGIPQTERQVVVPLDAVYVSLAATEERPGSEDQLNSADRSLTRHVPEESRRVNLGEVLSDPRVVALGDPGSGKTTLLRYVAVRHAQAQLAGTAETRGDLGTARLPILVRVADYAEDGLDKPLSAYFADWHTLAEAPTDGLADLFATALSNGEALILLDGLDEIVSAEARQKVVQRIDSLVERFATEGNRFLVTSRVAGYREFPLGASFRTFRVSPMDDAEIGQFLSKWCRAVEASNPELPDEQRTANAQREIAGITEAIRASPGVRRLATNPLLLTILTLIHRTGAALPQKRISLYDLAVGTLARTWRRAQGVPEAALVDETLLTRVLSNVAYWLHVEKHSGVAKLAELEPVVEARWAEVQGVDWDPDERPLSVVKEVEQFLTAVRVQTGLLVERSPDRYGFMHLTFEEYFVARQLVARHRDAVGRIRQHLHDPRWEEPILLALGFVGLSSADDAASLVEAAILARGDEGDEISPSLDEDILGRDFRFAVRCLGDLVPVEPRTRTELLATIYRETVLLKGRGGTDSYRDELIDAVSRLEARDARVLAQMTVSDLWVLKDGRRNRAREIIGSALETDPSIGRLRLPEYDAGLNPRYISLLRTPLDSGDDLVREWLIAKLHASGPDVTLRCAAVLAAGELEPDTARCVVARLRAGLAETPTDTLISLLVLHRDIARALLGDLLTAAASAIAKDADGDSSDLYPWIARRHLRAITDEPAVFNQLCDFARSKDELVASIALETLTDERDSLDAQSRRGLVEEMIALLTLPSAPIVLETALLGIDMLVEPDGLNMAALEAAEPLLDHPSPGVRVAALELLLWRDVSPDSIARALQPPFDARAAAHFAELQAVDYDAFLSSLVSYVRAAGRDANPVAAEEVAARATGNPALISVLRAYAAECRETASAAVLTTLIRLGSGDDRRMIAEMLREMTPDSRLRAVLALDGDGDLDDGALAMLDAADEDPILAAPSELIRAFHSRQPLIGRVVLQAIEHEDPAVKVLGCDAAVALRDSPVAERLVESMLRIIRESEPNAPHDVVSRRAAAEALTQMAREESDSGPVYTAVRSAFLSTPDDADTEDSRKSDLFEILLGALTP